MLMRISRRIVYLTLVAAVGVMVAGAPAIAQQRGTISGQVADPGGLVLPGATIVITEQSTGFSREVVSADNGAYLVSNLDPGVYDITVDMPGFAQLQQTGLTLSAGAEIGLDFPMQLAGLAETITVTGEEPLVESTSNRIGGALTSQEIDDVPANFRHIGALTQLIPGMTPNPAASSFEGGQVTANGVRAQSNVYLVDGMYNNDDRLGGSQGTQVRVVLDNIAEYQVLSNQYSTEYGGGAGAIINMVTRGGTNNFSGRVYSYFRDDQFNARGHFLPDDAVKPAERTMQAGFALGGPIVRNRAHFYFTIEKDNEDIAGQKLFPAEAAPLAEDFVGAFEVRAMNYFGRGDVQVNDNNFVNVRWVLETAPTRGEGFNTNTDLIDAQGWESDWDQLFNVAYTSVLSDNASNVIRVGRIGEQLNTGQQTFFDDNVGFIGLNGRNPFELGQANEHPGYNAGKGGTGRTTRIRTYTFDDSFSYFAPNLMGSEHTFKIGGGFSLNQANPRSGYDSGTYTFESDLPYDPANPATFPSEFEIQVGSNPDAGFPGFSKDRRHYFFTEDRWRVSDTLTLNLGVRYDHQLQTPGSKDDFSPRAGFAWDPTGTGTTVVRGGVGRFYSYLPISVVLNGATGDVLTQFPTIQITDPTSPVLQPDMITDSAGNPGVATLSPAGRAEVERRRDLILGGTGFNRNPQFVAPDMQLPYHWAWSVGVTQQLLDNAALTVNYVGNASRDQLLGQHIANTPIDGVRPSVDVWDPAGILVPAEARGTNFRRVRLSGTYPEMNGIYNSLQVSLVKRLANRVSGRMAYTVQRAEATGLRNPDSRRVSMGDDIRADYGRAQDDRTHVFASTGTFNVWRTLNIATVVSAITGRPVNEVTGLDGNGDTDRTDRPVQGVDDGAFPIRSELDSQGRAVINGLEGPGSFLVDMSVRYGIPLQGARSVDLFMDVFNLLNRENLTQPTGNRRSSNFMISTAAQFARQAQFGIRLRF
jgi:hypothetical protein